MTRRRWSSEARTERNLTEGDGRGQANLLAVAVALVVLVGVTGTAIAIAEVALSSEERDSAERATAVAAADRLVAADADATRRANVIDRDALAGLTVADLEATVPELAGADLRVRVGGEVVLERGDPTRGTTVRRIALLAETDTWSTTLATDGESVTVPRRTDRLTVAPVAGTVETVRVDDRVRLHDPDGIGSEATVSVSRHETLTVTAAGDGAVELTAHPETTEKAMVEVTVDA